MHDNIGQGRTLLYPVKLKRGKVLPVAPGTEGGTPSLFPICPCHDSRPMTQMTSDPPPISTTGRRGVVPLHT